MRSVFLTGLTGLTGLHCCKGIALVFLILQGCLFNPEPTQGISAEMTPTDVVALLGQPQSDTDLLYRLVYHPKGIVPYSSTSNFVVDSCWINFYEHDKIRNIFVGYKPKNEQAEASVPECNLSKFMPSPMSGKWGKIRTGMSRKEVQALLGTPDMKMMADPGGDLGWCYHPKNIPYSFSTTDFVIDELSIYFRYGFDEVAKILISYTRPNERRRNK